jgi:hypothetical protein
MNWLARWLPWPPTQETERALACSLALGPSRVADDATNILIRELGTQGSPITPTEDPHGTE